MPQHSSDCNFFNEILRRQRRIRRTDRQQIARRILANGPEVHIKNEAYKLLPARNKRFHKAVDIFIASRRSQAVKRQGGRVDDPRAGRTTIHSSRMASTFANLPRAAQLMYLNCADFVGSSTKATVCSDPFLLFLCDFDKECAEADERSRREDGTTGGAFEDVPSEDEANHQLPLQYERRPSQDQVLEAARQTWNALSDEAREPYRFRAITAALFPAAIDQAF
ncbi:ASPIC/UnbV domain-containing protein [Anopheles sinensis]|uniref:ASPIC/UnbV domain-containing protein n=1 Tax=Anopheles sinensis TaxID=74873 RepID=A0A084W620_ANOSI|nr:ASPIC/UnbV domain-containing protein [Anopheles sinensis]